MTLSVSFSTLEIYNLYLSDLTDIKIVYSNFKNPGHDQKVVSWPRKLEEYETKAFRSMGHSLFFIL